MIRPNPCFKCGARASCRHREVEDVQLPKLGRLPAMADLEPGQIADGRKLGKARQRMIDGLKAQLR